MVELEHRSAEPAPLLAFRQQNPDAPVSDFDSPAFSPAKQAVKAALNEDQGRLCAYCERPLAPNAGQIDHIKPKGGPNAHPDLCYQYRNYAHSCIDNATCGQKKKNGLLPIEPAPGCNTEWTLSTDSGEVVPVTGLTRQRRHAVIQTSGMLGLNTQPLLGERKEWVTNAMSLLQTSPADLPEFMATAPFRFLLGTVL